MWSRDEIVDKYGDWTAMCVHLGDGNYTIMPPRSDRRLARFLQVISDAAGKPFSDLRVLDLATLEGHYAIEFAMQGADSVGIEGREANIEKAKFAQQQLGLENVTFFQDDVRNLTPEKYGTFDVVLCAGILYHLDAPDVFEFMRNIASVCTRVAVFDTFIGLHDRHVLEYDGKPMAGLYYIEHDDTAGDEDKESALWSSIDNTRSFWPTPQSLCNLVAQVGFTSFFEVLNPALPECTLKDRRTYLALKGPRVSVLTSPITADLPDVDWPEGELTEIHEAQNSPLYFRSKFFFKKLLPQPVKDAIKPALRAIGVLAPDGTPAWQADKDEKGKGS